MKTKSVFLLAALAVVSLFSVSCSSDEDLTANEEEKGVVKTEFTISFPRKVVSGTRMAGSTVQLSANQFRGIKNMELYPFDATSIDKNTKPVSPKITLWDGSFENIIKEGTTSLYANTNSKLYQDVDIPYGTKMFMFYGEAGNSTENLSAAEGGQLVKITPVTLNSELSNVKFGLQSIASAPITTNSKKIEEYLTTIAKVQTKDAENNDIVWATTDNVPLRSLYESFITMHAGSWTNVRAAVSMIYDNVKNAKITLEEGEHSQDSENTRRLKVAIKNAICNSTYGVSEDATNKKLVFGDVIADYPADNNLPDGAAYIKWDNVTEPSNPKFVELINNDNTGLNMASFKKYVYPAALYYRVISGIKTSNKSESALYSSSSYTNWTDLVNAYADANATTSKVNNVDVPTVTSKTRSIAIVKQAQYAVCRFDVKIMTDNSVSSLEDNTPETAQTFTVGTKTFPITGLLVNGQKPVDFEFHQLADEEESTLYDPYVRNQSTGDSIYLGTSESAIFSTLVLESTPIEDKTDANKVAAAKVPVALEFRNSSTKTIVGRNGQKIYPGCKFYLVGTLDPSQNTDKYFNNNSSEGLIDRAFAQDHTTTVTFKIKSLKDACNELPDLSLPQLELGLSVDLGWTPGIVLNNVVID